MTARGKNKDILDQDKFVVVRCVMKNMCAKLQTIWSIRLKDVHGRKIARNDPYKGH